MPEEYIEKTSELNKELVKFRNLAEGRGIRGFISRNITKKTDKHRIKCENILSELYRITVEFNKK